MPAGQPDVGHGLANRNRGPAGWGIDPDGIHFGRGRRTETVEDHEAHARRRGGVLARRTKYGVNTRIGFEHGPQELRLVRVNDRRERLLLGELDHGAVVGGERIERQQPRFEQTGCARSMLEHRFLL